VAIDPVRDREKLVPILELRRLLGIARSTMDRWWRVGLRDPLDPSRRIRLETCHNGVQRCTTDEAYLRFCKQRGATL